MESYDIMTGLYGFKEHGIIDAGKSYKSMISAVARKYGIPEILISHQVHHESGFNPKAVSSAGAVGLMQIMPATALAIAGRHDLIPWPLPDPRVNLNLGVAYMRELFEVALRFNKDPKEAYKLALVGYFAGPRRIREVAEGGSRTAAEKKYVDSVIWDYETTESWAQLRGGKGGKVKAVSLGSLLFVGVAYIIYKKSKK